MFKQIILSLIKTVAVATALSLIISHAFSLVFLDWFLVCIAAQFIMFYMWNSFLEYRLNVAREREETERITSFMEQGVDAICAYCNASNFIPIKLDDDNEFNCTECNKDNSVYVDITIAQKTQIIDKQSLNVSSYVKEKIDATKTIRRK